MNGEVRVSLDDVEAIAVEFYHFDAEFHACVEAGTNAALALNEVGNGSPPPSSVVGHMKTAAAVALVMAHLCVNEHGEVVFSW